MHNNPESAVLLNVSEFDTHWFDADEGFDVWRESIAPLFDIQLERQAGFSARAKAYNLGDLAIADSSSSGSCIWRDLRGQGGGYLLVQLHYSGGSHAVNGCREMLVRPGDVSVIDLDRRYFAADDGYHCLSLILPCDLLFPLLKNSSSPGGLVLPGSTALGHIVASHLKAVWHTLPQLTLEEAPAVSGMLLGVIANAFGPSSQAQEAGRQPMAQALLTAVCEYIEAHLANPELKPELLCRKFGCSRSHLYRLFEPYGGVASYITERRLLRCYRQITKEKKHVHIATVAYSWGFSDQSHFSRLFRRTFGLSPREAQRQSADHNETETVVKFEVPCYRDWLKAL